MKKEILKPISQYGKRNDYRPLFLALEDKMEGRITQQELTFICFLWSYHYALPGYLPLPATPSFMAEFYRLSESVQHKVVDNRSERSEKVRAHLDKVYKIQAQNRVNKEWLEEMLLYLTEPEKVQKVKGVLNEF